MSEEFIPPKSASVKSLRPNYPESKEPPKEVLSQTFTLDPVVEKSNNDNQVVTIEQKNGTTAPAKIVEGEQPKVETPKTEQPKVEAPKKEEKKEESKLPSYLKPPAKKADEEGKTVGAKDSKQEDGKSPLGLANKTFTPKKPV